LDNKIKLIPTDISLLKNLLQIAIENNKIKYIPTKIGLLNKLNSLYISNNKLSSIPTEIGLLNELICLYFSNNKLKSIHIDFSNKLDNIIIDKSQVLLISEELKNKQKIEISRL
jgi:leucine-rich repeat protein SHOC2